MERWTVVSGLGAGRTSGNGAQRRAHRALTRKGRIRIQLRDRVLIALSVALLAVGGLHAQESRSGMTDSPFGASSSPMSNAPWTAPSASSSPFGHELTLRDRTDMYLKSLIESEAIARPLLGAAVDQAIDTPPQWGQGAPGFGRRTASGFAQEFTAKTIKFGVAALDREDPRFHPSGLHGFAPRLRFAVLHTFISRTDGGGQSFAYSRMAGIYGGAFIANSWFPAGYNDFSHGLSRGSVNLAVDVGFHVLREFAPDIKNRLVFSLK